MATPIGHSVDVVFCYLSLWIFEHNEGIHLICRCLSGIQLTVMDGFEAVRPSFMHGYARFLSFILLTTIFVTSFIPDISIITVFEFFT